MRKALTFPFLILEIVWTVQPSSFANSVDCIFFDASNLSKLKMIAIIAHLTLFHPIAAAAVHHSGTHKRTKSRLSPKELMSVQF